MLFELGHRSTPGGFRHPRRARLSRRRLSSEHRPGGVRDRQGAASRSGLSDAHPQEIRRRRPDRGAHRPGGSAPADPVADAKRRGRAGRAAGGGRPRHGAAGRTICPQAAPHELAGAMQTIEAMLASARVPEERAVDRPAAASHRRHRLGHRAPVPPLCRGIWLERRIRGAGRRDRRGLHPQFPARQGILLDRREGRRARRRRVSRAQERRGRAIAPAACRARARAVSASARSWSPNASTTARRAGYRRLVLWTNDVLVDARRLYERAGFKLVARGTSPQFRQGSGRPELGAGL